MHPEIVQRMSGDFAKWAESIEAEQQKVLPNTSFLKLKPGGQNDAARSPYGFVPSGG